jgi:hypothetical protein
MAAFGGVLTSGLLCGVMIGAAISLIDYIRVRGRGQKRTTASEPMTLRFLALQSSHDKRHWKVFVVLVLAPFAWGIQGVFVR